MRAPARNALILLLTVGLLAYFLRNADLAGVWIEMRRADPSLLVLGFLLTALTYALRAVRWLYLLRPLGVVRYRTAFRTTVIGFAASFVLPARAGEVLRPYLLARQERLSAPATFATVILERLFDLFTVVTLFAAYILFFDPDIGRPAGGAYAALKLGAAAAAAASVAILVVVFAAAGHPERLGRAAERLEHVLPQRAAKALARFTERFARGLAVMREPRSLIMALVLAFPLWLSIALATWIVARAFHITFPFTGTFLLLSVLVVGVAVPTPGAIGGFHAAFRLAVTEFFGVPEDRAVGAAIVLHAITFIPVTLAGILFMMQDGMSLSSLGREAAAASNDQRLMAEGSSR